MHIIDSHFHWWPRSVSERFCKRKTFPRAHVNDRGGYTYLREDKADYVLSSWTEWFDLDRQLETMDKLGHQVDVVLSIGPFSVFFSELPPDEGREAAIHWNEEMAGAQKKYPGRVWASAQCCHRSMSAASYRARTGRARRRPFPLDLSRRCS